MEFYDGILRISWSWSIPDKWQLAISIVLGILLIAELYRWKRANDRLVKKCYEVGYKQGFKASQCVGFFPNTMTGERK